MRVYFAGVSRIVELEAWLVKSNAARLLSFYYEVENKVGNKGTKAFRVWKALKNGDKTEEEVKELFTGNTKRKGIEATSIYRAKTNDRLTGVFGVWKENEVTKDESGKESERECGKVERVRRASKEGREEGNKDKQRESSKGAKSRQPRSQ